DVNIVRGVIDKNAFNDIKLGKDRISLFKINGGFDVFKDGNGFFIDHNLSLSDCPNIILPSKEQNYDDAYFKTVFTKSASKLRDADVLVFIGYSLPEEDHTIRFLLKNFFDSEESDDKEVFIISRNKDSALSNTYPNAVSIFSKMEELEAIKVLDGDLSSLVSFIG
ncbi:hypothetical protein J7I10_002657, partial [Vibrio vulnificus]|nr:hypothetical protein [Vibrio vulnificus]